MTLILLWLAVIGAVTCTERSVEQVAFAIAALACIVALLLLIVADLERAILLAAILAAAIVGASTVKYNRSGIKLTVADFPLAFAGTVPFFLVQYRRATMAVLAGSIGLILAAIATLLYATSSPLSIELRILLFAIAFGGCALAYRVSGGAVSFRRNMAQRQCFFSTFMASFIDTAPWRRSGGLSMSDIAKDPLPLMVAIPARTATYPDIIIIQHESIFDPRLFGLAVEPNVEAFLSPRNGLWGGLNVDIYGGGSWQSEFSLLTGLSSANFGADAYFLFKRGVGRFHHSLPNALAALGYKTMLTSSCRRNFLNYDKFYRSIGIGERIFSDDFPPPFDVRLFEETNSDAMFLEAALGAFTERITSNRAPRFLYALTNFNHGPHDRRLVPPGNFERERAFAATSLPDAQYAEYYARLAETAATWQRLKSRLATYLPGRPMLIVHYGDHQPVLTRRIEWQLQLPEDTRRQFRTFYAIECLNIGPDQVVPTRGAILDIAFLGTIALQEAGLPLDRVFATRASLLDDCGEAYFASSSDRKRRFHRTLVDLGIINLAPADIDRPLLTNLDLLGHISR
jgi:sulfatase-like protein